LKKVIVVLSPEAEEVYNYLNKEAPTSKTERMILNAINKKVELIKINYHYGNPIAKDLIPQEYKEKYGITNLFRIELPNYWRMLYTLTDDEIKIEIIAFVLD
jgi:Txe/YoeB family toxin of Txe-Axe toxin-antitoxin module